MGLKGQYEKTIERDAMSRLTLIASAAGIVLVAGLTITTQHYRHAAEEYQRQRDESREALAEAEAGITAMQKSQAEAAALDAMYSKELADAKAAITQLERDVAAGRRRLQLKARCPAVPEATSSPGVDDAGTPGLIEDARRDYFRHRADIETTDKMIRGLQDYIRFNAPGRGIGREDAIKAD